MSVEVRVSVETWVSREPDPEDRWDQGDEHGTVTGVEVRYIPGNEAKETFLGSQFNVDAQPGDVVFVVLADYESGNTFGRSGGQYQLLDVFTDVKDAYALAKAAQDVEHGDFNLIHAGKEYYVSWTGYFESLQAIRVMTALVQA